jgi:hypothetical protein
VLIGNVGCVDEEEGILTGPSALIGLDVLDHCRRLRPNPILEFLFSTKKGSTVLQDRKMDSRVLDALGMTQQNKRIEQVIESGAHVVDTISDQKRPLNKRGSRWSFRRKMYFPASALISFVIA